MNQCQTPRLKQTEKDKLHHVCKYNFISIHGDAIEKKAVVLAAELNVKF
jgi:hypothetical protein